MGGLFQLLWERGGDFQELGHHPLFSLSWLAWEETVMALVGVTFSICSCMTVGV